MCGKAARLLWGDGLLPAEDGRGPVPDERQYRTLPRRKPGSISRRHEQGYMGPGFRRDSGPPTVSSTVGRPRRLVPNSETLSRSHHFPVPGPLATEGGGVDGR